MPRLYVMPAGKTSVVKVTVWSTLTLDSQTMPHLRKVHVTVSHWLRCPPKVLTTIITLYYFTSSDAHPQRNSFEESYYIILHGDTFWHCSIISMELWR